MKHNCVFVAATAMLCCGIGKSRAQTIVYTEEAIGSGSFDGIAYTNAEVVVTSTGSVSNITSPQPLLLVNEVPLTSVNGDSSFTAELSPPGGTPEPGSLGPLAGMAMCGLFAGRKLRKRRK